MIILNIKNQEDQRVEKVKKRSTRKTDQDPDQDLEKRNLREESLDLLLSELI